ncbi:uncharacterized protein LOC111946770 [Oryzias latipes]
MTSVFYILGLIEYLQKYVEHIGSFEVDKLSENISGYVLTVESGEPNLSSLKWLTYHPLGYVYGNPPFWSTGVDCFGPLQIKLGHRVEKRWGILFKCMTTRCTHIELLHSLDTDSFLLATRRFIARRGRPHELLSDCGTNFKGGDKELREAFAAMNLQLKEQLSEYQINFQFNPLNAPHFGGVWEREIRSVKAALKVAVGSQTLPEEVLHTVLVEIEGILNSKPIGYASSDIADPDPVTPNLLLMGRRDASLPQAVYADTGLLGRRKWRHSQVRSSTGAAGSSSSQAVYAVLGSITRSKLCSPSSALLLVTGYLRRPRRFSSSTTLIPSLIKTSDSASSPEFLPGSSIWVSIEFDHDTVSSKLHFRIFIQTVVN